MRPLTALATGLVLVGCTPENSRDTVTFSCEAPDAADPGTDRRVVFHFEDRFLFVTNDSGGADNVCTQVGTRLCDVKMTDAKLTLRQQIDTPYCGWRDSASTMLDINRDTGAFTFHQEGCDPDSDMHLTGLCDMQVKD
tara:strand:- start:2079 stop:2492 length:414 start_codon:yes stop_codon:yes gene_type:complete